MSFKNWDPLNHAVQSGLANGRFANGALTLIASGPPELSTLSALAGAVTAGTTGESDIVWPIGLVQNYNIGQGRQFMRVFEIGSERSFWIAGRATGQLSLARVWMDGPSLLRSLYAYYQDLLPPVTVPWVYPNQGAEQMANPHDVIIPPGYENMYLNLASDLFSQPFGMLMMMRNSNLDTMGAIYLENCVIPNHGWSTDSQGTMVQESSSVQYERIVPVNVNVFPLVTGFTEVTSALGEAA